MVGSIEHDLIYAYVWHRICFCADDYQLMQDRGLIPRVFQELFAQIRVKQAQQVCLLSFWAQVGCMSIQIVIHKAFPVLISSRL